MKTRIANNAFTHTIYTFTIFCSLTAICKKTFIHLLTFCTHASKSLFMRISTVAGMILTACLIPLSAAADQHYPPEFNTLHNDNMIQFGTLIDSQFKKFSNRISERQKQNALAPNEAEAADSLKFDVNFEVTSAKIEKNSMLEDYSTSESPDTLYIPKFQFTTELSANWNMGAFYSSVPDSNIQMFGGELHYSLFQQHDTLPALSVRGTYTELTGIENTFVTSKGLELAVSRGFNNITPYAGFSTTWLDGEYQLAGYTETQLQNKYFLGMQFSLGMFTFAAETEQNGEHSSTNAKFGVRF